MKPILRVENLTKIFPGSGIIKRYPVKALDNINFSVEEGDIFGLVGESGSGKTTLARCILFLDPPTSGKVYYGNLCLNKVPPYRWKKLRSRMQIIFQDPNSALNPRLPIRRSLEEGLINLGYSRKERNETIRKLLDQVGIPYNQIDWYPHEFSGGQKQRIIIARALSMKPKFIVLDEPVSNLDVSIQAGIINLLMDLKNEFNLTYIFISHDLELIAYLSTKIGVLKGGQLVEAGRTEDILSHPLHPYTRFLLENPFTFHARMESMNPPIKEQT
ncbi:MAG: ABC transporter ATP-binding protein [Spirochaetales bacterium]